MTFGARENPSSATYYLRDPGWFTGPLNVSCLIHAGRMISLSTSEVLLEGLDEIVPLKLLAPFPGT